MELGAATSLLPICGDWSLGGLGVNGKFLSSALPMKHSQCLYIRSSQVGGRWQAGTPARLSIRRIRVRAMTEVFSLERAAEAYERMMSGKARFRVVFTTN